MNKFITGVAIIPKTGRHNVVHSVTYGDTPGNYSKADAIKACWQYVNEHTGWDPDHLQIVNCMVILDIS